MSVRDVISKFVVIEPKGSAPPRSRGSSRLSPGTPVPAPVRTSPPVGPSAPVGIALDGSRPLAQSVPTAPRVAPVPDWTAQHPTPRAPEHSTSPADPDAADFNAIYRQRGISPLNFTAEQALQMLAKLPLELPVETKRQTVRAMLDSISASLAVTPAALVEDAARKIEALNDSIDIGTKQANDCVSTTEAEIAVLKNQILERQRLVEEVRRQQDRLTREYRTEADRLATLVEFFGPSAAD